MPSSVREHSARFGVKRDYCWQTRWVLEQHIHWIFPTLDPTAKRMDLQLRLVCDKVAGMTDAYAVGQDRLLANL